jgi:hypothetical protein
MHMSILKLVDIYTSVFYIPEDGHMVGRNMQ